MNAKEINKNINTLERSLKVEKGIRFTLLSIIVLLVILVIARGSKTIVVLEPLTGVKGEEKTILYENSASEKYLIDLTRNIIDLTYNITPKNVEAKLSEVLNYVAPEDYQSLRKILSKKIEQVKANGSSTVFLPQEFKVDKKSLKVLVTGKYLAFSGNKVLLNERRTIRFDYVIRNHYAYIKNFIDVTNLKNPMSAGENK